jgi:ankyrin repeat protein
MRKYLLIRYSLLLITGLLLFQIVICQQTNGIHNAISSGDLKKVSELIEKDPTLLDLKDINGNTPLNIACGGFRKQLDIARYLINKGADINTKNNNGSTPLHNACSIANPEEVELVKLLILKGADVNAPQNFGATPLSYATTSFDAASFLIEHGADINATTDGNTILHYALTYNPNDDLSRLLIEK